MSMFDKYNKKFNKVDWGINTKEFEFVKCSDQKLDKKIPIYGFFITPDSGYGEGAIVILKDTLLAIPQRYVEQIKDMLNDKEIVEAVKAGNCGIVITEFESKKFKKTGYDVEFVEM